MYDRRACALTSFHLRSQDIAAAAANRYGGLLRWPPPFVHQGEKAKGREGEQGRVGEREGVKDAIQRDCFA